MDSYGNPVGADVSAGEMHPDAVVMMMYMRMVLCLVTPQ